LAAPLKLKVPCGRMRIFITICLLLIPNLIFGGEKADRVLVVKSQSKLYLMKNGKVLSEYSVTFGAKPIVSVNEMISGQQFESWVQRYNASGIFANEWPGPKEDIVYTSDLRRSFETGRLIGNRVIRDSLFREVEVPLLRFPPIRLKAKVWLAMSRSLWLLGLSTKCESFNEARRRAKRVVERIEFQPLEDKKIVIIGHGFFNRLIKQELLQKGWFLGKAKAENGFLGKMSFQVE
jgi:broad specificity phosphatase PhoE